MSDAKIKRLVKSKDGDYIEEDSWRNKRSQMLDKMDSGLQERVNNAEQRGWGKPAAAIAAGLSAVADFVVPEDALDVAGNIVAPIKGVKAWNKLKKADKAYEATAKQVDKLKKIDSSLSKAEKSGLANWREAFKSVGVGDTEKMKEVLESFPASVMQKMKDL